MTVPGLVAITGRRDVVVGEWVAGQADTTTGRLMTRDTVFDLASLTKVIATTTVTLALIAEGRMSRTDVADAWPVTVRQLLTHTAGLPATRKFFEWCDSREQLLAELYATPLEAGPGTRVRYSDLGFMALGEMIAEAAGEPLDQAFRHRVAEPLGMTATGFNPPGPPERFAATEIPLCGVVHDENARVLGGVAGHAGLFGTAADLARFATWWVGGSDEVVPAAARRDATRCHTEGLPGNDGFPGRRGLGWTCPGDRYDILGGTWPPASVSHTGFTGTSIALDPGTGRWLVLLTNAVHHGRDPSDVKALRQSLHATVAQLPR